MKSQIIGIVNWLLKLRQNSLYNEYRKKYDLHRDFSFNGDGILLYGKGRISIDGDSYLGYFTSLNSVEGHKIAIGRNCHISHNVRMYTRSPIVDQDFDRSSDLLIRKTGDIQIGNGVWIGANVYIGPGVIIGDNAVIGANSVVTKSIGPSSVWAPLPINLIRQKRF